MKKSKWNGEIDAEKLEIIFGQKICNDIVGEGVMRYEYLDQIKKHKKELERNKLTTEQAISLFEEYILKSIILFGSLCKAPQKKENDIPLDARFQAALHIFISNIINHAKSDERLSKICYRMAMLTTKYLMNDLYENPSQKFCKWLSISTELPFIISPWDSAAEIKNTVDNALKKTGLASALNIKSKCRYSAIPTKIVIDIYRTKYLLLNKPCISKDNFDYYWNIMKVDFKQYFNYRLPKEHPKYYCKLRDDRGDKTPVYIKRKLWLQYCKQALKVIAKIAEAKQAASEVAPTG